MDDQVVRWAGMNVPECKDAREYQRRKETAKTQTSMVQWHDVRRALVKLCNGKGIGPRCVPDEILKPALDVKESDDRAYQPISCRLPSVDQPTTQPTSLSLRSAISCCC